MSDRPDRPDPSGSVPKGETHSAQSRRITQAEAAEAEAERTLNRTDADALDETMTMAESDARREVPRLRDDAVRPRKSRKLPPQDRVRPMLSSNMKKEYSRTKRQWERGLPKTRRRALNDMLRDQDALEGGNRALRGVHGTRSSLPTNVRERISNVDRTIQDYERINQREHVVYAALRAPTDHGNSRNALLEHLRSMSDNPESEPLTFDGYVPATHSLGNIANERDVVLEMRTKSGAYVGTSDTTPNADHIVNRGRSFQVVGVHEVAYTNPDGTEGTRTVVQVDDVTDDGRTSATT